MYNAPEGWRLVPEKLTAEMMDALEFTDGDPYPERRWQALLDAAPAYKEKSDGRTLPESKRA